MPYVDLDISEIYDDMNGREKKKVAEWLWEEGELNDFFPDVLPNSTSYGLGDADFCKSVGTILENRHRLSNDDYETILKISKKI